MKIYSVESAANIPTQKSEVFIIEPLDLGHGTTVGSALRRILLSEIYGFAITEAQISNVPHEFSSATFIKEDILEVIFNLRQIILKPTELAFSSESLATKTLYKSLTKIRGPLIVTAGMLNIPNYLKVLNPNQYICTIVDNTDLELAISICYDKGFKLSSDENQQKNSDLIDNGSGFLLDINPVFSPIKKVNFKVKAINDTKGNIRESLVLQIETNGAITPLEALQKSVNFCLKLFYPMLAFFLKENIEENFL